jgi:hypothetical protein
VDKFKTHNQSKLCANPFSMSIMLLHDQSMPLREKQWPMQLESTEKLKSTILDKVAEITKQQDECSTRTSGTKGSRLQSDMMKQAIHIS